MVVPMGVALNKFSHSFKPLISFVAIVSRTSDIPLTRIFVLLSFKDTKEAHLEIVENGEIPHQKAVLVNERESERNIGQENSVPGNSTFQASTAVKPPLDHFLQSVAMLGVIMFLYYLCDDDHYFPATERTYSRDLFWFLVLLLVVVAAGFTRKETPDKILNREQTEEWKGWMQVMFVWYHYFKAAETYNAIRVFIAAYVWMTGFGE